MNKIWIYRTGTSSIVVVAKTQKQAIRLVCEKHAKVYYAEFVKYSSNPGETWVRAFGPDEGVWENTTTLALPTDPNWEKLT